MPLPDSAKQWPPATLAKAYESFEVFDAWHTSDVEALGYLYAVNRLQKRTSVWGQVRRFFWGTPTPMTTTQRPNKMHVPVAADIARMAASVVLSDMPDVHFGDGDDDADDKGESVAAGKVATKRLIELLDDNAHATLLEAAESKSALGGVYVRVTWDLEVNPDGPFLTWVSSDSAVPEFRWGRLSAVTFWRELPPLEGSNVTYKLLERHEPGRIEWGLYQAGDRGELGMRVPLSEHPDAAFLSDIVDENASVPTGSELLTAVYVSNGVNNAWRKDPGAASLGRSDYQGVEDLFDQLDEVYTAWMRDIRLGKARIVIPKGMLEVGPAGQGAVFNADQEVFTELGEQVGSLNPQTANGSVDAFIQMFQPNIRYKEHLDTVVHLLARIYQACGFSPQSFGDAGEVAVTATEVSSRAKLTTLTRAAQILRWRPQLSKLFAVLLDVDKFVFQGPGRGEALPDVEFTDADALDPKIIADTVLAMVNAEAISLQTRVEQLHPDWDPEQVNAEIDRIREDYAMLPENKANFLWAATAANGSATGGVDANSYGVKGANAEGVNTATVPRNAPDQAKGTDALKPGPQPKGT